MRDIEIISISMVPRQKYRVELIAIVVGESINYIRPGDRDLKICTACCRNMDEQLMEWRRPNY